MAKRGADRTQLNLGIDFGTRFTRVTYFDPVRQEAGLIRVGMDQQGFRQFAIPSLAVRAAGSWLFGYEAERYLEKGRWDTLPSPVRSLKRRLSNPGREGSELVIDGDTFAVTAVIADFLRYVLQIAEPVLRANYPSVKIDALPMNLSVPVLFDDRARAKISEVYADVFGEEAGDKLVVNEPTAAAMAEYKAPRHFPPEGIAVFDAGAGTTDVTILNKVGDHLLVVDSAAAAVGGDDIDVALAAVVEAECRRRGVEPTSPSVAKLWAIERRKVTRLKERLSTEDHVDEVFTLGETQVPFRYSSGDLEKRVSPIAKKMVDVLSLALDRARRQFEQTNRPFHLSEVLVVGGSSYVPMVRRQLERAISTWIAETRQTYGKPAIRHVRSLPGATQDAALFAVALGTAYPASSFEEISLGRVPYDAELVLGGEGKGDKLKVVKLLDAYAPLPAAVDKSVAAADFFPPKAKIRFLQAGAERQSISIPLDLRKERNLQARVEWKITLASDASLNVQHSINGWRTTRRFSTPMPWQEFIARRVRDIAPFWSDGGKYPRHGTFLSEGHGDGSPG
jgi:molecular chaperone DnaK (HSP70)